jgi:hypothetical protein
VKKELVDPAVKAIDALIMDELQSPSPARYGNIDKLCKHAHAITQMAAKRVKDVVQEDRINIVAGDDNMMYAPLNEGYVQADEFAVEPRQMNLGGVRVDQNELMRELITAMASIAAPKPTPKPQLGVRDLLDIRERLVAAKRDTVAIDKKIDDALQNIDNEVVPDVEPAPYTPDRLGLTAGVALGLAAAEEEEHE